MTALDTEMKQTLWISSTLNPVKIEEIWHGTHAN